MAIVDAATFGVPSLISLPCERIFYPLSPPCIDPTGPIRTERHPLFSGVLRPTLPELPARAKDCVAATAPRRLLRRSLCCAHACKHAAT